MSIANLKNVFQIDMQNLFLDGNAVPGQSGKLILGNQDVSGFATPTDLYIHEVLSPNDPNNPGAYVISYQAGGPNLLQDVAGFLGTGGSNVGNGTITALYGDVEIGGIMAAGNNSIIIDGSGLNLGFTAPALATDVSGYVVPVQSVNGQNKGALSGVEANFDTAVTDTSIFVVDTINNTTTIYINCVINSLTNQAGVANVPLLSVSMTDGTFNLPPINSDFIDSNPNQNLLVFYGNINNLTTPANATQGLMYAKQVGSNTISIFFNPALTHQTGDKLLIQGVFSYPN